VHQDLIDDDLGEQRGRQAEQLNDERGGEDLAENLAVLPDRGNKPRQVERTVRIVESEARLDQE